LSNTRGRITVAVLAAGLLAVAGCSTKASDSAGTTGAGGVKTGTGVTADTITVGQLSDLSGPFAAVGKSITQAQQLYYDQISAAGGVCGRKINVVTKDTGYNTQNGVTQYQQLKDQVVGLSQVLGSPINAALLDQYTSDKMLTIPASNAASLLANKQIMLVGTTYDYETINTIDYALANNLIHKGDKIGHIYPQNEGGVNALQGSQYAAQKNGLTVIEKKTQPTDTDMTAQVTDLKSQGVKAIAIISNPTATASAAAVDAAQASTYRSSATTPTSSPACSRPRPDPHWRSCSTSPPRCKHPTAPIPAPRSSSLTTRPSTPTPHWTAVSPPASATPRCSPTS